MTPPGDPANKPGPLGQEGRFLFFSAAKKSGVWERFEIRSSARYWDVMMGFIIRVVGMGVIAAVGAILVFIIWQVLPLARGARVDPVISDLRLTGEARLSGFSPDGTHWWVWNSDSEWLEGLINGVGTTHIKLQQSWSVNARVWAWDAGSSTLVVAAELSEMPGAQRAWELSWIRVVWGQGSTNFDVIESSVFSAEHSSDFDDQKVATQDLSVMDYAQGPDSRITVIGFGNGDVWVRRDVRRRALVGTGNWTTGHWIRLSEMSDTYPDVHVPVFRVLASESGNGLVVLRSNGQAEYWFFTDEGKWILRQRFSPLGPDAQLTGAGFVFGDVSLLVSGENKEVRRWILSRDEKLGSRVFIDTGEIPGPAGRVNAVSHNLRNKSVVLGGDKGLAVVNSTTGSLRWRTTFGDGLGSLKSLSFDASGKLILAVRNGSVWIWRLDDPHQDAGWAAFFCKLWYEGRSGPEYVWQSTSGTDTFEPKYSLVPLIFGSLKGAFYSLLISVPLALAGALYVSQIMRAGARAVIKPVMEVMASIPSVVLGFIGALWLAPLLAPRVPSLLIMLVVLPVGILFFGWLWSVFTRSRQGWWTGREWLGVIPVAMLLGWLSWHLGPVFENFLGVESEAREQALGLGVFPLWWREVVGLSFEQRNALVVGLMMGFAVIPVIFTIAEDAFTNVPASLKAGASALGASRWQVAWMVVLPVALSGVFSAVVIGLGRAIGETMIVVMVSGNTAIIEWNPFSGMRPLSANIAVEMPEAARGSTHYRVLFLGGLILFMLTFVLNTVAELVRQSFRKKMRSL